MASASLICIPHTRYPKFVILCSFRRVFLGGYSPTPKSVCEILPSLLSQTLTIETLHLEMVSEIGVSDENE